LVRRYFAISARVSRSSSTTRMFGDAVTMGPLPHSGRADEGYLNNSNVVLATGGNTPARQQKGRVNARSANPSTKD
jgi:hypothetical protein